MTSNLLSAIHAIVTNTTLNIETIASGKKGNRIQWVGEGLERYVKDAFADTFQLSNDERKERYAGVFSHQGSANNPPDFMMIGGDAVEVKKKNSAAGTIPLNSSYPKQKLFAKSPMITEKCRNAEVWTEKDLLYAVGHVRETVLLALWFVYGDCYAASAEVYEKLANHVRQGVIDSGLQLSRTNELARVNQVDPLGKTSLRVRGMWQIEHPSKFFRNLPLFNSNIGAEFALNVIMKKAKYLSFPEDDRQRLESLDERGLVIKETVIDSPDNPNEHIDAIIMRYSV